MSRSLGRILCWLGIHRFPRSVDLRWSIRAACERCGALVDGGLATPARRRR